MAGTGQAQTEWFGNPATDTGLGRTGMLTSPSKVTGQQGRNGRDSFDVHWTAQSRQERSRLPRRSRTTAGQERTHLLLSFGGHSGRVAPDRSRLPQRSHETAGHGRMHLLRRALDRVAQAVALDGTAGTERTIFSPSMVKQSRAGQERTRLPRRSLRTAGQEQTRLLRRTLDRVAQDRSRLPRQSRWTTGQNRRISPSTGT